MNNLQANYMSLIAIAISALLWVVGNFLHKKGTFLHKNEKYRLQNDVKNEINQIHL